MAYPDVPADNNSSERAMRAAKVKDKISGGFRSPAGATRFADLLSLTHTLRKQHLPLLDSAALGEGVFEDVNGTLSRGAWGLSIRQICNDGGRCMCI